MIRTYTLEIAGLKRELPVVPVAPGLAIASFVILGDCELVTKTAPLLAERLPEVDLLVTMEAKGIPLVNELCRIMDKPTYVVARKTIAPYMKNPKTVEFYSSRKNQMLCIDGKDAALLAGKKVAIVDDVISTGESLLALEKLLEEAGAQVVAKAAILAEGSAAERKDIIFLAPMPMFSED